MRLSDYPTLRKTDAKPAARFASRKVGFEDVRPHAIRNPSPVVLDDDIDTATFEFDPLQLNRTDLANRVE
jgi:hypothetical protein